MIPLHLYTPIAYHALLCLVIITFSVYQGCRDGHDPDGYNKKLVFPLLLVFVFYIGLRPLDGGFGDMGAYADDFWRNQSLGSSSITEKSEWLFRAYVRACAPIMDSTAWFLLTAALYTGLLAIAFYKIHKTYTFTALLFAVSTYSFWSYGTNGIRNGLATSILILRFAFFHGRHKWGGILTMIGLFFAAGLIHKSTLLPIACFLLTFLYNRPFGYLLGWGIAVILSLFMGGFWEDFFTNLNLVENTRLSNYLLGEATTDVFSRVGFRWDFLLYSLVPIGLGWYYIYKKKFHDPFYFRLFNTYVAANAFWVLVCRAPYSNRFAYLSWFLMSWVIVYPLITQRMFRNQWSKTATILLAYYAFTYFTVIIQGK